MIRYSSKRPRDWLDGFVARAARSLPTESLTVWSCAWRGLRRNRERQRLLEVVRQAESRYRAEPALAKTMATVPLGPLPPETDLSEMAAWTVVANLLLNLDEMLAPK